MPQINLGRVRGEDGGFGNVTSEYVNDGGEPNVEIIPSGEDSQKDFKFIFSNLVNDPIDSATIDRITNDQIVNSSDTLTATGLTTLWGKIKSLFALKTHTHGATGIDDKAITQAKIADGAVGETQLETTLRNSIFQEVNFADRTVNNLLQVSLDNRDAEINRPCKIATTNAGSLDNRAPGMPTSGSYVAMREVRWFAPTHVLVVITEAFPVPGRIWANFYNTGTWDGWQEH